MVEKNTNKKFTLLFTEKEIVQIETAIAEAEKTTSGEIINLVVSSSDPYFRIRWMGSLMGWIISSFILLMINFNAHWSPSLSAILECQFFAIILGFMAGHFPFFIRLFSKTSVLAQNVHRECLAHFISKGLHYTRYHTGVLIYISLLERRVEILADKGIHTKVDQAFWNLHVSSIIEGLKKGKSATAVCDSIKSIGETLSRHFPPDLDNQNELSNKVLFDK